LALKALLPYYAGQVKCIYIDPPYNTGNEGWIYNDNVNSPEMKAWLGKAVGKEAEDLTRHDKWLCMMYPRLQLLREFLREDGAIFVSIDDNEIATLRMLMDEIFGAHNFVATIFMAKKICSSK
jgi:site-specific DNA-methyltransferase (adenine-specific)/adenine-specific DNA-methyltransferase